MPNAPVQATAEGSPKLSRRSLLGGIAGAAIVTAIPSQAIAATHLDDLIRSHRESFRLWLDACDKVDLLPPDRGPTYAEDKARERQALTDEQDALERVLSYRPISLEDNANRLDYICREVWMEGELYPGEWQQDLLFASLLPIGRRPA